MRRAAARRVALATDLERQRSEMIGADFVRIELELVDTFCKLALNSHSAERKRQHEFNARRALEGAMHALAKLHLKEEEAQVVVTQIEEVQALLKVLEGDGSAGQSC